MIIADAALLWADVSAPMDSVAPVFERVGKGVAIAGESRLAMFADTPTECVIIKWTEYKSTTLFPFG